MALVAKHAGLTLVIPWARRKDSGRFRAFSIPRAAKETLRHEVVLRSVTSAGNYRTCVRIFGPMEMTAADHAPLGHVLRLH